MSRANWKGWAICRPGLTLAALLFWPGPVVHAQSGATNEAAATIIDLPTVLRLARAGNLEVSLAREGLADARAAYQSTVLQFLPWLSPGISFRRHEHLIQDVSGNIIEANKQAYSPGAALTAQVDLGESVYRSLAARQDVRAAEQGLATQRQNSVQAAVAGYFDLLAAQAQTGVSREAWRIAGELDRQLGNAVGAGLAYRGDELRARIQAGQAEQAVQRAVGAERIAGARLAERLHLDPAVALTAADGDLVPLALVPTNTALAPMVAGALARRPELRQSQAGLAAAEANRRGAAYGPLIPTVGGQAYFGGLGGGVDNGPSRFGQTEDFSATLSWRIGPGGLFDPARKQRTRSREESARLAQDRLRDQVIREVVESLTRFRSLAEQLETARKTLAAAVEAEKLAGQRKEFAVGIVLETIQTQQDLARARDSWVTLIAEFNKSQYDLQRVAGVELDAVAPAPH